MSCPFHSTGRSTSHWNEWSCRVYTIPFRNFVPEWINRGELTPVLLAPAWHLWVLVRCKQIQSYEREPEWTRAGAKVARCHVNTPLANSVSYSGKNFELAMLINFYPCIHYTSFIFFKRQRFCNQAYQRFYQDPIQSLSKSSSPSWL